jgi:hypothetical protein
VVRHHIVQFAGNPGPLLLRSPRGLPVEFGLGAVGPALPQVYSGANNFWLWGPPPAADSAAIAVNVDPALLRRDFTHVRRVATFWNGLGVDDDEQRAPVYLATGLRTSWSRAWPAFRVYA